MAKLRLEPVTSQPTLSPAQLANLSGLAAQDAITTAINSAAVQVAKENNISLPQASLIVQSEVNQSFQQPDYVPNIPASLVPSLDAYKASLNAQDLAQKVDALAASNTTGTTPSADVLEKQRVAAIQNSWTSPASTDAWFNANPNDPYTIREIAAGRVANQVADNVGVTTPSADTLANLGGTGTAKVTDTGTIIDNTKLNTQGDVNKIATSPAATSPPSTINTGSIPALTTADLASWGKTLPQGLTSDQLKTALEGQQTALSGQNANFLKDWNTSADALKTNILSGVDTKNQAFGTQATQGFMDAFKNFQIPTNQQTGVNLGNYNDNRNAAADQWWSQYVTGRR